MEANLLNTKQAAAALKMSHSWLALARSRGEGPEYLRIGRGRGVIRYTTEALQRFVDAMTNKKG